MKKCIVILSVGILFILILSIVIFSFFKYDITIEKAELLYNSFAWNKIGQRSEIDSDTLLKHYKYRKTNYNEQECFIFNIKDSVFKLYAFPMPDCNTTYLFQMALVNEELLNRDDVFEIGDNIDDIIKKYPDITLFENDHVYFEFDELSDIEHSIGFSGKAKHYFEILNSQGLYSYGLDKNGDIIVKIKFDFNSMNWMNEQICR